MASDIKERGPQNLAETSIVSGQENNFYTKTSKFKVLIIGAGISGITTGIELTKRLKGTVDFLVIERDDDVGGVWYKSKWPGAAVDTYAHNYAYHRDPYDWKERYATRDEVYHYWRSLVDKYELKPHIRFRTIFVGSEWLEKDQLHRVTLKSNTGETYTVLVNGLICASGPLSTPRLPNIPNLQQFRGEAFHNLNWNEAVKLEGRRIGIIGSGSSAVQITPEIAKLPGTQVTQFIRSGGYFKAKSNAAYPAIVRWAFRNVPGVQWLYRAYMFLLTQDARWSDSKRQTKFRLKVEQQLTKYLRATAPEKYHEALTATFPFGCKRPPLEAGWLKSLHRDNVTLTSSKIISANESGLTTEDGKQHDLDVIIFATGAHVATTGCGASQNIFGLEGKEVAAFWKDRGGPEAFLGLAVPTHPNFWWTIGPNSTSGAWSYTSALTSGTISRIIQEMICQNVTSIAPTWRAFEEHNDFVKHTLQHYTVTSNLCTSWYKTETGKSTMLNPYSGIGYWWKLRNLDWAQWSAWTKVNGKVVPTTIHTKNKTYGRLSVIGLLSLLVFALLSAESSGFRSWPRLA